MRNIERMRPGAKAFIVHERKILVIKERVHRDDQTSIIYDVPGGGIDLGETMQEALHREVKEEVGLEIEIERPIGGWDFMIENPHDGVHIICIAFQCKVIGSPITDVSKNPAQEDIFETLWLTKEEILRSQEIFSNKDMIRSVENIQLQ